MSDVNRVMFDAAVIRAEEAGEHTTNEEWAIQYAAAEIESLTTQLAEARAERGGRMMDEHELHRTLETICDGLAALVPRHGPDRKELINRARWHQTMMHRTDRNEVKKPRNSGGGKP